LQVNMLVHATREDLILDYMRQGYMAKQAERHADAQIADRRPAVRMMTMTERPPPEALFTEPVTEPGTGAGRSLPPAKIRAWARTHGHSVAARGRIAEPVVAAYLADVESVSV